jgi:hypothetical protein
MKRSLKWAVVTAATVSVLGAGFVGGRAWAGGIPAAGALTYSGVLQKVDGTPLTSTGHNLEIKLWSTGPTGGTALCDTTVPAPTFTLDNSGRFSVPLDNSCTGAIGSNTGAWVEILLDGNTLNRTKLGAVPYAVEANHAVSADTATIAVAANAAAGALSTTIGSLAAASSLPKVTAWADFAAASVPVLVTTNGPVTNVTTTARWRRVGDSVQMRFQSLLNGMPSTTGQMFWTLPSGFNANVSSADRGNVGLAYVWSGGTSLSQACQAEITGSQNQLYAYCTGAGGPLTTTSPIPSPYEIDFDITYPVQTWTVTQ